MKLQASVVAKEYSFHAELITIRKNTCSFVDFKLNF